jgi:nitrogen fixation NifU-like protein
MDDLRELYQATILDHNRAPRNFGELPSANRTAEGSNPICGDQLQVYLEVDSDERVVDVRFEGKGCAISTASASLMTEFAKGKTRKEIEETFERFHNVVTGNPGEEVETPELGKLAVFSGVREYPVRVKCATLSWHTLRAALDGSDEAARTE